MLQSGSLLYEQNAQSDYYDEASAVDRLVVPFDKLLALDNLQNGLQLGTNTTSSHVLLGHRGTKGISGKQVSQLPLYTQYCYTHVFPIVLYAYTPNTPIQMHTSNAWPLLTQS
jgi:hypothetical protein